MVIAFNIILSKTKYTMVIVRMCSSRLLNHETEYRSSCSFEWIRVCISGDDIKMDSCYEKGRTHEL